MFPTLSLGPFVIPTAGLVILLGVWLALSAVEWAGKRLEYDAVAVYNLATIALVVGVIAARLAFVFFYWSAYRQNLLAIIWPLTSGFNGWAGLFLGAAGAFFYGRARQLQPALVLDALTPGILVGLMAVAVADFVAGPGYGTATSLPWALVQYEVARHPVQLYELLVALAALAVWGYGVNHRDFPGQLFLWSVVVYGSGRLFVDAFRANAWLTAGGYHGWQIVSLTAVLGALLLIARQRAPAPA
jgi:phosphatidylglycerol---prolipoprotein diacylglyceryl transferase